MKMLKLAPNTCQRKSRLILRPSLILGTTEERLISVPRRRHFIQITCINCPQLASKEKGRRDLIPRPQLTNDTFEQLNIVKLQVLGLRLGVDFTFTLDNNDSNDKDNDNNNPHLNFFKGTVLGVKEQGLGIRDKA